MKKHLASDGAGLESPTPPGSRTASRWSHYRCDDAACVAAAEPLLSRINRAPLAGQYWRACFTYLYSFWLSLDL